MRRTLLLGAAAAAATLAAAVGGIGVLHLPAARPALLWVSGGGCPIGEPLDRTALDAARARSLAPLAGQAPSPSRPGLGFALTRSTRAELVAWAHAEGIACEPAGEARLVCTDAPAGPLHLQHPVDELVLQLDADDRLIGLAASRRGAPFDDAELEALGPAHERRDADLDQLLAQRREAWTFEDLRVVQTETRLRDGVSSRLTIQAL